MLKKGDVVYLVTVNLTDGIKKCVVQIGQSTKVDTVLLENYGFYKKLDRDIFVSKYDAIKAAEKIRGRKIQSLKKQLAKFENMKFDI